MKVLKVSVKIVPAEYFTSIHELIRMSFPGAEVNREDLGAADVYLEINCREIGLGVSISGRVWDEQRMTERQKDLSPSETMDQKTKKIQLRKFTYQLLCQHLDRNINAYGILTGMRPVKTVHTFMDQGLAGEALFHAMQREYLMEAAKAQLLGLIGRNNRPWLHSKERASSYISIYIGIPFCPTRCYYCSFPGAILVDYGREIPPFLQALKKELEELGQEVQDQKLRVENIYIGGGTPTVLREKELEEIFHILNQYYISSDTREITVEAGRPDTLSYEKIRFLKRMGVNRICINPQTMNDHTLERIGRKHDQAAVIEAVGWAKEAGIEDINMDLILGLPGEGMKEFIHTSDEILKLQPTNVTVHSLAVKRGSRLAEIEGKSQLERNVGAVASGIEYFRSCLQEQGYDPYYLYRQKYMKANVENTGYGLPEHYCAYNIQVMEERQTIIGMGGGAASKFVCPADWKLTNLHNPKDPLSYVQGVDRLITAKVDKLRGLN